MKLLKHLACIMITLSLICPSIALADEEYIVCYLPENPLYLSSASKNSTHTVLTENEKTAINRIVTSLADFEAEINISDLDISSEQLTSLSNSGAISNVFINHPELFYVEPGLFLYSLTNDNKVVKIKFNTDNTDGKKSVFTMTKEEAEKNKAIIEKEYANIASLIPDDASDLKKALIVHDYIASNYEYDESLTIRTLDETVKKKKCVCQGYTYLYMYVMNKLGVECTTVPSDACTHIWNKIKIGDNWYNVDITSDDPLKNMASNINHKCFLVSDNELKEVSPNNHSSWNEFNWDGTPVLTAKDEKYDNSNFHKIKATATLDGDIYTFYTDVIENSANQLCKVNIDNDTLTPIYTEASDFKWYVYGNASSYYPSMSSSIVNYNGELYFNSPNAVFKFNTDENTAEKIYDYNGNADESKTYFWGITIKNNKLYTEYTTNISNGIEDYLRVPIMTHSISIGKGDDGKYTVSLTPIYTNTDDVPHLYIAEHSETGLLNKFQKIDAYEGPITFEPDSDSKTISAFALDDNLTPFANKATQEIE